MKLIGGGRASEVFDLGDGRVLRRFRAGGDPAREALVMGHALEHGFPVPRVLEVTPDALILDRIEGPTMLAELRRRPWTLAHHASTLAGLHKRLHGIEAPPTLPAAGEGDRLLHLDLHPDNVILASDGPFVIDWTNAQRGTPALDVALTCVILATNGGPLGQAFYRAFVRHFDRTDVLRALPAAAERRLADVNVDEREGRAVRRFVEHAA